MEKSKYMIESAIAMRNNYVVFIQQIDFNNEDDMKKVKDLNCHIYFICSRPRITLSEKECVIAENEYNLVFNIHLQEGIRQYTSNHNNNLGIVKIETNNAGNYYFASNKNGEICSEGKISLLFTNCISEYHDNLDLKVHYVGQAFGNNGERLAIDRLGSHDTLQKIYSDLSFHEPKNEVWLVLINLEPFTVSKFGGYNAYDSQIGLDESIKNYSNIISTNIPLSQQITIMEAALIKHFKPTYNIEYKTTFPSKSHTSYEIFYNLDFNSVSFQVDTESIKARLYSDSVASRFLHCYTFTLHSEKDRKDMFKY